LGVGQVFHHHRNLTALAKRHGVFNLIFSCRRRAYSISAVYLIANNAVTNIFIVIVA